ncbi:NAD(P)-binding domain-containing protein [Longispora sp. NPDC051575]|uniref:NADPH-dependent F420 reductase n=1 Tax=Longispora sp. NPDC051575 TaxID=3154943 RepID=UPI0034261F2D
MTSIAILGSGRVGRVLATGLAAAGHTVTIGTLDPTREAAAWADTSVAVATHAEATEAAEVIVNALPGDVSVDVLRGLTTYLEKKVLIDVANATERGPDGMPGTLCYPDGSLAEELQHALPTTHVVKTLNTMVYSVMAAPATLTTPGTVFLSGDDPTAKSTTTALLTDLGWHPDRIIDLGDITTARAPEAFALLIGPLFRALNARAFALGIDHSA